MKLPAFQADNTKGKRDLLGQIKSRPDEWFLFLRERESTSRTTQNAPCYHLASPPASRPGASRSTSIPLRCNGRPRRGLCKPALARFYSRCAAPRPSSTASSVPFSILRALCDVPRRLLFSSLPLLWFMELRLVYDKSVPASTGVFAVILAWLTGKYGR